MLKTWHTEKTDQARNIVHVTPDDDLVAHDTTSFGACVCGPYSEAVAGSRCSGWIFVHHSLDAREDRE